MHFLKHILAIRALQTLVSTARSASETIRAVSETSKAASETTCNTDGVGDNMGGVGDHTGGGLRQHARSEASIILIGRDSHDGKTSPRICTFKRRPADGWTYIVSHLVARYTN